MSLMTRTESGASVEEFTGFYRAHFGRIATQLHAYLGDAWEAQDLTQEAFCRAFDRWDRISGYDRPDFWVRQVAWNLATNRLRHLRVALRHLSRQREEFADGPTPDRIVLLQALAKLPPKQRLAIVQHHIGGLSTSEIAEQQGVAEGTVRSWLSRGRSAMADQLREVPAVWDAAPAIDKTFTLVRRKRAIRRGTLAAILAVLVALPIAILLRGKGSEPPPIAPTTPPAKPVSSCTAKILEGLKNEPAPALIGGEPSGRFLVGANYRTSTGYHAVLWIDGVPSTFAIPSGFLSGIAVNSRGVVAGSSDDETASKFKVWTYHDGRLEILMETSEKTEARSVVSINARGDLLLSGSPTRLPALRLAGRHPVLRELSVPAGASYLATTDLGEDGTVVGYADDPESAVVWTPDGAVRRLATPEGWTTKARRIRGDWVVGSGEQTGVTVPATGYQGGEPLRWNLRTGELIRVAGAEMAVGVTSQGWVLASTAEPKGFIVMDGARVPLPTVAGGPPINDPEVSFISDDGRVVAGNSRLVGTGDEVAIRWTCS